MNITRREVLKGLSLSAGGLFLSPILQQIQTHAAGSTELPKRFVFVLEGNGLPWQHITPRGLTPRSDRDWADARGGIAQEEANRTRLVSVPLGNHALPRALEPVAAYKNRLTIINGLSGRVTGGGHSTDFGALGVYNAQGGIGNSGTPQGETIDVALGNRLGGIFPQIGLGMLDSDSQSVVYNCSASGRGRARPTICRPDVAYRRLFGSVANGAGRQEFMARTNVLDFLRDDLNRVRREVPAAEQTKLEAHLEAYESMRHRQSRLNEIENSLREHAPVVSDKYTSAVETDRLDAQFDLAAAALLGGLTQVVTVASGVGNPFFGVTFSGLGINFGKHSIGHRGSYDGKDWQELATIIRRFHFELIARLMRKLEAVPEGNGTVLDNTLIVYLSDAAERHHSLCFEWPVVVLGNLGGRLRSGRYIEYPYWGRPGHREIGNLYTTLLHAVGDRRAYFGIRDPNLEGDARGDGPLSELLA
jgi:hypothetical protein